MNAIGEPTPPARLAKSATAFRTIGEVADDLDLPAHVLRFWESKFPQLKPLKRGGGRRYYRPEDIVLLRRIRQCLYQDGYTIRGVQKLLGIVPDESEDATASPTLFPLEAAAEAPSDAPAEPPTEPPPARRPDRRSPRRPARPSGLDPSTRSALEELRRELREARNQLDPLLPPAIGG